MTSQPRTHVSRSATVPADDAACRGMLDSSPCQLLTLVPLLRALRACVPAGEQLAGEYMWGVYDLLLLPPSFPYGGMENPCLTFVTPTLLAGDRSLTNVVAHEIAHSWTGGCSQPACCCC